MCRVKGATACSGACAKLPLGLGFHGCAHLSCLDNKVLFSLSCPASAAITGCGRDNSYGGAPWKTSLATLRAHPLAREGGQADYRPEHSKWSCRPAVRQAPGLPQVPRLRHLNADAVWLSSALLPPFQARQIAGFGDAVPVLSTELFEGPHPPYPEPSAVSREHSRLGFLGYSPRNGIPMPVGRFSDARRKNF